nr:translation initiation factor IF-2-like [Drosophila suzukii]
MAEQKIESPVFEKVPVKEAAPEKPTADKENGAPAADSGALSGAVDGEKATAEAADKEEESAADGEEAKNKSIEAAPADVESGEEAAIGASPDAPAVGPVKRKVDVAAAKADEAGATPEKKSKLEEECTRD